MDYLNENSPNSASQIRSESEEFDIERVVAPCSLHELAPYIGKMRPELAAWAIERVTKPGQTIYDPFCGSGTVLLEGALKDRNVIGSDLNPYACLISRSKVGYLSSKHPIDWAHKINGLAITVEAREKSIDLRRIPIWVREFYHPETLRSIVAWRDLLIEQEEEYLLTCLLAIAHHQRPGFLSYPASHTVPYLRTNKYPRASFPEMYEKREVAPRLIKKALRSSRNAPIDKKGIESRVFLGDAATWKPHCKVDAIITSPPYMGQLHYARDNRLRLWFLGNQDWQSLDKDVSPYANVFVERMANTFSNWSNILKKDGSLAILVGDTTNSSKKRLDRLVANIAEKTDGAFCLIQSVESTIPNSRRTRKGCAGSKSEALLILKKKG
jgi:hypothetical protein